MGDKRVTVWVQRFADRSTLMLQWIDPETGRRKSKSAGTADEGEAEAKRVDLESDLNNGRHQEASRMTWERFRELFEVEYVAPLRIDTRDNYAATLNLFETLCDPQSLRSINARTVSRFAAGMRATPGKVKGSTGMMPSSIKVRLQFLHTALAWAVQQGMLPAVPTFPEIKVPKKDPQPVPVEAFERLLAKAGGDREMCAYLLCGWLAGLRLGEAVALEWEESATVPYVDLARNRIVLPAEFVKAVKDQWVPLDRDLRAALEALPRHGRRVFRFTSDRNGARGRPLSVSGVSQRVSDLAKKANVRITMKTLRRGFGCRYAGKVSAQVLQKLMRHANIKTTMDYYANVDAAVEEAVLGPQRNSLRNNSTSPDSAGEPVSDTSHYGASANSPSTS
jgi:integrase